MKRDDKEDDLELKDELFHNKSSYINPNPISLFQDGRRNYIDPADF